MVDDRAEEGRSPAYKPYRLGEVDAEAVAAALVFAGHLGRGGEAGAQRVPGEQARPLPLGDIAAHAARQRMRLTRVKPIGADRLALVVDLPEQAPVCDRRELELDLQRHGRAGGIGRAAPDFDLAPAGFADVAACPCRGSRPSRDRPQSGCDRHPDRPPRSGADRRRSRAAA